MTGLACTLVPQRIRNNLYHGVLDRRIEHLPSRRFTHETASAARRSRGVRTCCLLVSRIQRPRCEDMCEDRTEALDDRY
jgi:hypothetical protein